MGHFREMYRNDLHVLMEEKGGRIQALAANQNNQIIILDGLDGSMSVKITSR